MKIEAAKAQHKYALEKFRAWKGYPLPELNSDMQFDKEYLHRKWVAFLAGMLHSPIGKGE
ncbi:hypothetical protein [Glaciimonas sp. PCH181]|uniref:hypothetical protein n=1 Tax=Glaciimonas sp. PCH181 TaxID=2133943 RepID=UPI000D33E867|nr:hypothetical protein [Glaciimonas sp. PCH181]PUA19622.1 hypothetical protein C7W93_07190 [Glaciimonas sp. PCH181]